MEGLISVIVPCYNQAEFLEECLTSVLNQTYSNWECIIINDGSADLTKEIANNWIQKDKRFKYVFQENKGLSSARNTGLVQAKGEYIQFLDSDDFLDQEKFSRSIKEFSNPQVDIVISNFKFFNEEANLFENPNFLLGAYYFNLDSILFDWGEKFSIPIHSALLKSALIDEFYFPIELEAREDWIFWIYLFRHPKNTIFIDEPLVTYRIHKNGMTRDFNKMKREKRNTLVYMERLVSEDKALRIYKKYICELQQDYAKLQRQHLEFLNSNTYKFINFFKIFPLRQRR
ncbi:glycosyltransferase family 2 protein [Leeuwenhoekiella sp. LLG6367-2.1]|uniref:glycosyltransferase family 2 protein n=1 Tax=Leeuwenhoekiella sp. LLG6367-2.1 TaxID=3160833 RepID=UPI00386C1860